ncbi:MAG: DUF4038 domain-containing protein, partial [Clostridia bacterium]|nr:DUF4038 domain-containing protein [Clostridia bacterium]
MLTVNKSNRYILKNGSFFPYLADTAWTMLQLLNREEIIFYLDKRVAQGFNAVQVSAVSELGGLTVPNREGYMSFFDADPTKPDDRYFSIVEFLADECEKRNMVLTLLPTWGDKFNLKWGSGPEVFTPENAYFYGKYLAKVIGKRENIIWMLGGDRPIETENHRKIIDEMARGLREGELVRHLISYHPNGENSSANFLADADYIDFHTIQSSHDFGGYHSELMVLDTINKTGKPTIDAECFYEDFPIRFQLDWDYRFNPLDIRRRIYKNMLSGTFGHTYGHQSVWCFRNETNEEYLYDWKQALDRPMAQQMQHINKLLKKVDITSYKPSEIVSDGTIVLRSSNIINGKIDLTDLVRVNSNIRENQYINENDILICVRNGSKSLV